MINLKSIRFITRIAFFKIAIIIVYLFLDINNKVNGNYVRYLFIGLTMVTFIAIVIYLLGILQFLRERSSVLIAFKVFIGFELGNFVMNMLVSQLLLPKFHNGYQYIFYYYGAIGIGRLFVLIYLSILLFTITNITFKPLFAFFGIALLATSLLNIAIPFFITFIQKLGGNPTPHIYSYSSIVNILPIIAVIIIFNQTQQLLIQTENITAKDPFLTGYEEKSDEK